MDRVLAVASGKGGVGKSTVAANLAVAMANYDISGRGPLKVALVDVDFYGPSIPTLMGGGEIKPDHEGKIIPALKHGVKYISISFFLKNPDDPVVWRGPMFGKAIAQLFQDVRWGDVDICIVDMPPGTGDAQLSLSQLMSIDGALMVTTPQEVAVSDVRRAINMFRKVNVPVIGTVENMAGFVTPSGEKFDIFGSGGGEVLAEQYGLPMLGSIPIVIDIRQGGDTGVPAAVDGESESGKHFIELARSTWAALESQAGAQPQLNVVN
ncbi:MAG: Mrp/NBP35 family ATP-binding protein [Bdellovibrionales bacterium]|nr:Mrp/NBP35 family ATP-binding protein [Bdellovibrionales bacterium]